MNETGIEVVMQGPLTDPMQAAAAREFAIKGVLGLAIFFGLLYWWANR